MEINKVWAVFFSPCGSTERITMEIASAASQKLGINEVEILNFSPPSARIEDLQFARSDLVIFGVPTYAGRVPNKVMPFIRDRISAEEGIGAAVVTYGGRSYDDSLSELVGLLRDDGFRIEGGGAFVCQHAFAGKAAAGRPDESDLQKARILGKTLADKVLKGAYDSPVFPGNFPPGPYYVPKKTDGTPAVFLKAKPETNPDLCISCGLCADRCVMGSVNRENTYEVTGICIKCQACVRSCPAGAKYFSDEDFLSHKQMLEETFGGERKETEIFV